MSDLAVSFAEIEKRIKKLVDENRAHKKRVRELEKELHLTRQDAKKSVQFHDKQLRLRERVEKILRDLEAADVKDG